MHNNYYFLRQLTAALANRLRGSVLAQCFSQHADELILQFETTTKPFFIRGFLQHHFCCLSFPNDFKRARKNSIDLFQEAIGCRVSNVTQFENDRSFSVELEHGYALLFKMHGNRANIILLLNSKPIKIFRNHLLQDWTLQPDDLNKPIAFTKNAFENNLKNLSRYYSTFGKPVWDYLASSGFLTKSTDEKWKLFESVISILENPTYYIVKKNDSVLFSLLPGKDVIKSYSDPVIAIQDFFVTHETTNAFISEKSNAIKILQARLNQVHEHIKRNIKRLTEVENDHHFNRWADLLMTNLSSLPSGLDKVVLPDLYHDNMPVEIPLKKELTVQKNAELYYRKAKNRELERSKLKQSITSKQQQAEVLQSQLMQLKQVTDAQTLKQVIASFNLNNLKQPENTKSVSLPYREIEFKGFKIWIGKSARDNDELTQRFGYKDDLWLHAKDVSGSHVLIKYQAGKPFPKPVIERAAQLAAWHSKRKTDSLCPVTVTPKKFVRKRKGDPPGMVVVEREEVILTEPKA
ncbi:MAG: NFACT RNA binding domain-containing protein [Cyclobacteriaceae bacterium]